MRSQKVNKFFKRCSRVQVLVLLSRMIQWYRIHVSQLHCMVYCTTITTIALMCVKNLCSALSSIWWCGRQWLWSVSWKILLRHIFTPQICSFYLHCLLLRRRQQVSTAIIIPIFSYYSIMYIIYCRVGSVSGNKNWVVGPKIAIARIKVSMHIQIRSILTYYDLPSHNNYYYKSFSSVVVKADYQTTKF